MPRANVPVGRSSKRPCSSASICRAANFSCWATSATARPAAWRARASSTPTSAGAAVSVIFPALELLVLARAREAAPQLIGEARLDEALAELALDAQREPERLGSRLDQLVIARHEAPGVLEVVLAVADLAELQERPQVVRLLLQ